MPSSYLLPRCSSTPSNTKNDKITEPAKLIPPLPPKFFFEIHAGEGQVFDIESIRTFRILDCKHTVGVYWPISPKSCFVANINASIAPHGGATKEDGPQYKLNREQGDALQRILASKLVSLAIDAEEIQLKEGLPLVGKLTYTSDAKASSADEEEKESAHYIIKAIRKGVQQTEFHEAYGVVVDHSSCSYRSITQEDTAIQGYQKMEWGAGEQKERWQWVWENGGWKDKKGFGRTPETKPEVLGLQYESDDEDWSFYG